MGFCLQGKKPNLHPSCFYTIIFTSPAQWCASKQADEQASKQAKTNPMGQDVSIHAMYSNLCAEGWFFRSLKAPLPVCRMQLAACQRAS
jgi:hypothetical protein